MGGGTVQKTSQDARVPAELQPLTRASAERVTALQGAAPLEPFLQAKPLQVPGLSATQQRGLQEIPALFTPPPRVTGANLEASPSYRAAREAFTTTIEPRIVNQATLAGLGRSNYLPQAMAAAEAQYLSPLIEGELGREERGIERDQGARLSAITAALQGGGVERGVESERAAAVAQDELRRQALAEQALFTPFGALAPSTIGQQARTTGKQGWFA